LPVCYLKCLFFFSYYCYFRDGMIAHTTNKSFNFFLTFFMLKFVYSAGNTLHVISNRNTYRPHGKTHHNVVEHELRTLQKSRFHCFYNYYDRVRIKNAFEMFRPVTLQRCDTLHDNYLPAKRFSKRASGTSTLIFSPHSVDNDAAIIYL